MNTAIKKENKITSLYTYWRMHWHPGSGVVIDCIDSWSLPSVLHCIVPLSKKIYHLYRYITHFYCLAVEAGFYSDVVECFPLDPAAQVRFPPRAVGIFLHPVTLVSVYPRNIHLDKTEKLLTGRQKIKTNTILNNCFNRRQHVVLVTYNQ